MEYMVKIGAKPPLKTTQRQIHSVAGHKVVIKICEILVVQRIIGPCIEEIMMVLQVISTGGDNFSDDITLRFLWSRVS